MIREKFEKGRKRQGILKRALRRRSYNQNTELLLEIKVRGRNDLISMSNA